MKTKESWTRLLFIFGLYACQTHTPKLSAKLIETAPPQLSSGAASWRLLETQFRELRAKAPGYSRTKFLLASAQQKIEEGAWDLAEVITDEVLRSPHPEEQKQAWNLKAILAYKKHKPYQAEKAWQNALEIDPADLLMKRNLGYFYLNYAQFSKVETLYEEEPQDYHVQLQLLIAKRNLEDSKEVDARCEAMLKKYPEDKYVLYNCALHEFQNNQHAQRAEELLDQALAVVKEEDPMRKEIQDKWKEVRDGVPQRQELEK